MDWREVCAKNSSQIPPRKIKREYRENTITANDNDTNTITRLTSDNIDAFKNNIKPVAPIVGNSYGVKYYPVKDKIRTFQEVGITASHMGTILGVNEYESKEDYIKRIQYISGGGKGNVHTQYGDANEDYVRNKYADMIGKRAGESQKKLIHPLKKYIYAYIDGMIGKDILIEIKCKSNGNIPSKAQPEHVAQVKFEMMLFAAMGAPVKEARIIYWTDRNIGEEMTVFTVKYNPEDDDKIMAIIEDFREEVKKHYIKEGLPLE
jgi:hypothetical protein